MVCHFQSIIQYTILTIVCLLKMTSRPRTFDTGKSTPHFTSFQITTECTIKPPRFKKFLSSPNFRKRRMSSVRMQHKASFILTCYQHFQLQKHLCNSVSMHQLVSLISKNCAVSTFKESFQIPLESTSQRPYFQKFLSSFNFQTSFQIASECTVQRPLISKLSQKFQLPNHRFKQRQNAPFSVLDFNIFSAVPTKTYRFKQHQKAPLKRP